MGSGVVGAGVGKRAQTGFGDGEDRLPGKFSSVIAGFPGSPLPGGGGSIPSRHLPRPGWLETIREA